MEPKKIETLIHRVSPLLAALVAALALGACGTFQPRQGRTIERIGTELDAGIAQVAQTAGVPQRGDSHGGLAAVEQVAVAELRRA